MIGGALCHSSAVGKPLPLSFLLRRAATAYSAAIPAILLSARIQQGFAPRRKQTQSSAPFAHESSGDAKSVRCAVLASKVEKMNSAYIVGAVRTPIGKFGGALADFTAADMGVIAVRAALDRAFGELPAERTPVDKPDWSIIPPFSRGAVAARKTRYRVDEVIVGNARAAGVGPNVARQIAWRSGLGDDVPAFTINMACASGLRAVFLGWQQILLGDADLIVAAGTESMSRVPYFADTRWGFKMGHQPLVDGMYRDGLFCQISRMIMGETAEVLARQYSIGRDEQDAYALESQQRAARAIKECRFKEELVPMERVDAKGRPTRLQRDQHSRPDTSLESLKKLPPVFAKDGTITAGNASGITDGAAAVV